MDAALLTLAHDLIAGLPDPELAAKFDGQLKAIQGCISAVPSQSHNHAPPQNSVHSQGLTDLDPKGPCKTPPPRNDIVDAFESPLSPLKSPLSPERDLSPIDYVLDPDLQRSLFSPLSPSSCSESLIGLSAVGQEKRNGRSFAVESAPKARETEERPVRVVVKNFPHEIPTQEVLSDLTLQKIPVVEIQRMHRRDGTLLNMMLIVCDPTEGLHPIFNISTICGLSGLSIDPFVDQCCRCQRYGHSQRHCSARPRCVKCLEDHGTPDCPRRKDSSQCVDPPSCVLCGQTGHPANYRGCPKAPKSSAPTLTRADARQQRDFPTSPPATQTEEAPMMSDIRLKLPDDVRALITEKNAAVRAYNAFPCANNKSFMRFMQRKVSKRIAELRNKRGD